MRPFTNPNNLNFKYNLQNYNNMVNAINSGLIRDVKKVWVSAGDASDCSYCKRLDGKAIDMGEEFAAGNCHVLIPPLHDGCRCTCIYVESPHLVQGKYKVY